MLTLTLILGQYFNTDGTYTYNLYKHRWAEISDCLSLQDYGPHLLRECISFPAFHPGFEHTPTSTPNLSSDPTPADQGVHQVEALMIDTAESNAGTPSNVQKRPHFTT